MTKEKSGEYAMLIGQSHTIFGHDRIVYPFDELRMKYLYFINVSLHR